MNSKYFDRKTVDFLLYKVHEAEKLSSLNFFSDHDKETFDMTLDAAQQIAEHHMYPFLKELDRNEPTLKDGVVLAHPQIKTYLRALGDAGIIGADFSYEDGGSQLPLSVSSMIGHILMSANGGMAYSGLTSGAARLISHFGSQALKDQYIPNMLNGSWQGTMCLTEPQAGSSLSDINSTARPDGHGNYYLKGQKIFISAGDHDACDNVVHLVIARIAGAPKGSKGISLFVVPKILLDGSKNDLTNVAVFHKLGQKGVPTLHLGFGDQSDTCQAFLVGEANKGLRYMFQMMNEARIGVGVTGASIASAAYQASLAYAKERPQSRRLNKKSAKDSAQVPIIQHPDIRRMLYFQKAVVEGSLSLVTEVAKYYDLSIHADSAEEKRRNYLLLELLTPVAKTYPCEAGLKSVSDALQIFGGYGFTEDFSVEQYYRDIRITPIYEGTTGIQAQDLLGRKVLMENGKALELLTEEINKDISLTDSHKELKKYADELAKSTQQLAEVSQHLIKIAMTGDVELFLSDASLYMELFSLNVVAWQWLKIGLKANQGLLENQGDAEFLKAKIKTMKFFFHYELPKTTGFVQRLIDDEALTVLGDKEDLF